MLWSVDTAPPDPALGMFISGNSPIVAGAALSDHAVVFGDLDGIVRALDRESDALLWSVNVSPHPLGGVWGAPMIADGDELKHQRAPKRKVVGAGQKNGEYHVLDAKTGEVITTKSYLTQVAPEGGFQTGAAVARDSVFEHGITTSVDASLPYDGKLIALALDGAPRDGSSPGLRRRCLAA